MKVILFLCITVLFTCNIFGQHQRVSGIVLEEKSLEPVPFATCFDSINKIGVITNETGHFNLKLPVGKVTLKFSYIGYGVSSQTIFLHKDTFLKILISPIRIKEVTVIANEEKLHRQTLSGKTSIPIKKIEYLPSVAGHSNILKGLTYLPGVSNGKEGKGDLFVRGGNRDQNMILMDNTLIFNPYHAIGFLSGINTDVVKSIDFYKSGFPARYGGKSSSIIDITLKDGNMSEWHGKSHVGIISSDVMIEGPIKKEKTALVFAIRSSYFNILNGGARKRFDKYENMRISFDNTFSEYVFNFSFYDLNLKLTHQLNKKSKIFFNLYMGKDIQSEKEISSGAFLDNFNRKNGFNINSNILSINHNFYSYSGVLLKNSISFSSNDVTLNKQQYTLTQTDEFETSNIIENNINDLTIKSELIFSQVNRNEIRIGIQNSSYFYNPGTYKDRFINIENSTNFDTSYSYRGENELNVTSLFVEDEIRFSEKLNLNIGIRSSILFAEGNSSYDIEPRISIRRLLNESNSFKASYMLVNQYIQSYSENYQGIQREIWVGLTERVLPSITQQISIGFYGFENNTGIEYGIEPFIKKMNNLIYYTKPNSNSINYWDENILTEGRGEILGMEFIILKNTENLSATIAYTISWNNRIFKELNDGRKFPFNYDRRHIFNFSFQYELSKMYSGGLNFAFNSGARVNMPEAYVAPNIFFPEYSLYNSINNYELPAYHRLDIATRKHWKSKNGLIQHFNLDIYNLYARKNPVYIYIRNGKVYKKSFFTIIPTLAYGIEF